MMGTAIQSEYSLRESLREHVLSPIETAEQQGDSERAAVRTERDAYKQFQDDVCDIETVQTPQSPATLTRSIFPNSQPCVVERVRNTFQKTVMSVGHYDTVYDEPLDEHLAAEFSPEVAAMLQPKPKKPFTEPSKTALMSVIQRSIDERDQLLKLLERETESLTRNHRALTDLLDVQDRPKVPEWYRNEFVTTLDDISEQRQQTLQDCPALVRMDGHDLCPYLYQDQAWTYPVLTAITRFRRAVL